jgi:hypothetical protein
MKLFSLGGDGPKYEIVCADDDEFAQKNKHSQNSEPNYQRARVLCSYDAKDNTELNLVANEVCDLNYYFEFFWTVSMSRFFG